MKKFVYSILVLLTTATAVFSVLAYLGGFSWFFDLFSHFKMQYLLILIFGSGLIFIIDKKIGVLFLPFILVLTIEVIPIYFGGQKNVDLVYTNKLISINLLSSNDQHEDVVEFILKNKPDILVLQEITAQWKSILEPKLKDYISRIVIPREDNFGIAVYSKINIFDLEEVKFGEDRLPSITGNFYLEGKEVTLIATHPLPPIGHDNSKSRNFQLTELSKVAADMENELILVGDLNISSFSTHFKNLLKVSKLVDSRKGFGLLTTWPNWLYILHTTLDHCLVSKGIQVKSRAVGENVGSDHLPIVMEFGIR